jgi:predicted RNase H-like nuclease (RuvC/YqgF family)
LPETDELSARIENATRDVKEDFEKAVGTVGMLKLKMNELERRIEQKKPEEATQDIASLSSAIDSLERFTDSEILKSKAAWKKYEELKHECQNNVFTPPQLDELQTACKRTEQLAADLLCYSLGLIRQKNTQKS